MSHISLFWLFCWLAARSGVSEFVQVCLFFCCFGGSLYNFHMATNGNTPFANSVRRDDFSHDGSLLFMVPFYPAAGSRIRTLPDQLPGAERWGYYSKRDMVLLDTVHHEPMWADAIGIAVTKASAWGWEIESSIPLRQRRAQTLLLRGTTAGVFRGWVNFIAAHLRSFLLPGLACVEIERASSAHTSQIVALNHLNPLRCIPTDDPQRPLQYVDLKGNVHTLREHEVMVFPAMPDPVGEYNIKFSAAERAYNSIKLLAAIERYLYEKVSGKRALALHFIQGITDRHLESAIKSAEQEQSMKGLYAYMGAACVPIPGDIPAQLLTIPLAELPDGFDAQALRDDAYIKYANAIGLDPNDIEPRVAQARNLGSGAQSVVLAEKAKGKYLVDWRKLWEHEMGYKVLDDLVTRFYFSESTLDDDAKEASVHQAQVDTYDKMIGNGMITAPEGRALAVQDGILPREFATTTPIDPSLSDTEKPGEAIEPEAVKEVTAADVVTEQEEYGQLLDLIAAALLSQYQSLNVPAILEEVRGMEPQAPETLTRIQQLVEQQAPPLPLDVQRAYALLLSFAGIGNSNGVSQGRGDLSPAEQLEVQREITAYLAARLLSLLGQNPADAAITGRIDSPYLENGLSVTSYAIMARLLQAALINNQEDEAAIIAAYMQNAAEAVPARAQLITGDNAAVLFGAATYFTVRRFRPTTKTWLLSRAKEKRPEHLATVGETVPFESIFSNGNYWSQEEVNCQCGIKVGYD